MLAFTILSLDLYLLPIHSEFLVDKSVTYRVLRNLPTTLTQRLHCSVGGKLCQVVSEAYEVGLEWCSHTDRHSHETTCEGSEVLCRLAAAGMRRGHEEARELSEGS